MGEDRGTGDIRNANPDQLEELADKMWTAGDGGAYGDLSACLEWARALDVSEEMTRLRPLLDWLRDTAQQLHDAARVLRGGDPGYRDPIPGYVPPEDGGGGGGSWSYKVHNQLYADEFRQLAEKDDLTEEDVSRLEGLVSHTDEDPEFASYLIHSLGMADFLRLSREVGEMDTEDSDKLLTSMGNLLNAAMWVPGDAEPGSQAYDEWVATPQGRRYESLINAFNELDEENAEAAVGLLERSRTPIDEQFFAQAMAAMGTGAPRDRLMMYAARSNPAAVDGYLFDGGITPEMKAQWAANLLERGGRMTDVEIATLAAVMEANQDDEDFAVELATQAGAEGILREWTSLIWPTTDPPAARVEALARLQDSLGAVLGRATWSDDERMARWERDMIALGDRRFGGETAQVYGFQLMSSLMGSGHYSADFLTGPDSYGSALLAFERSDRFEGNQWSAVCQDASGMFTLGDDFREDPMTGWMDALARNPQAATDFFSDHIDMDYVLENRYDEIPGLGPEGPAETTRGGGIAVLESTGSALLAATTGVSADNAPGIMPTERHEGLREDQENIFTAFMEYGHEKGNDFPPEYRDITASMLGSYREAVFDAAANPRNKGLLLNGDQLAVMSVQVARDPDAFQTLSMNMNVHYVQAIHDGPTHDPKYTLEDVGRAIGFLDEARYAAIDIDADNSSWYGSGAFDLVSYGVNKLPYGPEAWMLIDAAAQTWTDTQNQAIEEGLNEKQVEYFLEGNAYLEELSRQWTEANPLPDQERANGVSEEQWALQASQEIADGALRGSDEARNRMVIADIVQEDQSGR